MSLLKEESLTWYQLPPLKDEFSFEEFLMSFKECANSIINKKGFNAIYLPNKSDHSIIFISIAKVDLLHFEEVIVEYYKAYKLPKQPPNINIEKPYYSDKELNKDNDSPWLNI